MILQYAAEDINWIMGLGIMFGLALLITLLLEGDMYTFFGFAFITNGLVVFGGLLEDWTLILNAIFVVILLYTKYKEGGKEG